MWWFKLRSWFFGLLTTYLLKLRLQTHLGRFICSYFTQLVSFDLGSTSCFGPKLRVYPISDAEVEASGPFLESPDGISRYPVSRISRRNNKERRNYPAQSRWVQFQNLHFGIQLESLQKHKKTPGQRHIHLLCRKIPTLRWIRVIRSCKDHYKQSMNLWPLLPQSIYHNPKL